MDYFIVCTTILKAQFSKEVNSNKKGNSFIHCADLIFHKYILCVMFACMHRTTNGVFWTSIVKFKKKTL